MGVELLVGGHDLLEFGMRKAALDANDDGFGHLVGDDFADPLFAVSAIKFDVFGHNQFSTESGSLVAQL